MLSGVTVSCFLLSYLVVWAVEASRFFVGRLPGRNAILVGMLVAGLVAHSLFLINQFTARDPATAQLLANWFQWSVLAAWGLAVAYLVLVVRNPNGSIGVFFVPMILGLIGLGLLLRDSVPFSATQTINAWGMIHGISLLLGTMFICFGAAFGIMYLIQSHRLKMKKARSRRWKLPTLEFLQSMNRLSLFATSIALAVGFLSGVILNVAQGGQIAWLSSGILVTFALFIWSLIAATFELAARGSLGGRRSAYLVMANFVFMLLVLSIVLITAHGQRDDSRQQARGGQGDDDARWTVCLMEPQSSVQEVDS